MFGMLRLILASMVALSHLGVSIPHFNQGVFAVVVFYLLAGMVSYKLLSQTYIDSPLSYYKNRLIRILPMYYISLIIAAVAYLLGTSSYFLSKTPHIIDWLSNISIIPLAYYMYSGIDTFTLLPPAWSLAVELQFYLLAPFLFKNTKFFILAFTISFLVFISASLSIINTDIFGYRLIIGVCFIFLLGFMLKIAPSNTQIKTSLYIVYFILISVFIYTVYSKTKQNYNYETLTALLISIPLLYRAQNFKLNTTQIIKKIDTHLGFISYGIFLLHFPSLWLLELLAIKNPYIVLTISYFLSAISHKYIEKHFLYTKTKP